MITKEAYETITSKPPYRVWVISVIGEGSNEDAKKYFDDREEAKRFYFRFKESMKLFSRVHYDNMSGLGKQSKWADFIEEWCLVYDTFGGLKHEVFSSHSEAFKEYESIVHREKGIYLVNNQEKRVEPINISFSRDYYRSYTLYTMKLYNDYRYLP